MLSLLHLHLIFAIIPKLVRILQSHLRDLSGRFVTDGTICEAHDHISVDKPVECDK
jgi:hypothetical protein